MVILRKNRELREVHAFLQIMKLRELNNQDIARHPFVDKVKNQ